MWDWAALAAMALVVFAWWRLDPVLRCLRGFEAELNAREPLPDGDP